MVKGVDHVRVVSGQPAVDNAEDLDGDERGVLGDAREAHPGDIAIAQRDAGHMGAVGA